MEYLLAGLVAGCGGLAAGLAWAWAQNRKLRRLVAVEVASRARWRVVTRDGLRRANVWVDRLDGRVS